MSDLSGAPIVFKEMDETHSQGLISIENLPDSKILKGDLGIQIAPDGRVWVCINGVAFLRFKPLDNVGMDLVIPTSHVKGD